MITLRSEYWTYKPNFIPPYVFEPFYETLQDYIQIGDKRSSCFFDGINGNKLLLKDGYGSVPGYKWEDAPSILVEICKLVEQYTNEKYDYVLVHIYPEGSSGISWHFDKEAIHSSIASVSLGATRKFRFRKIGRTKGWDTELLLKNGDLIIMHGPNPEIGRKSCQEVYQHCVPVEKTVKTPRINLTFRQY